MYKRHKGNDENEKDVVMPDVSSTGLVLESNSEKTTTEDPKAAEGLPVRHATSEATEVNIEQKLAAPPRPRCKVIIYNVQNKENIGKLIRSSVAFGVEEIIVIGNRKVHKFGNQNTMRFIRFIFFKKVEDAVEYLRNDGFTIVGGEIGQEAVDVTTHPFEGNTAFVFGNEGQGLNEKMLKLCDKLVYIPQYGDGVACLNITVAASIILHHFGSYAQYTCSEITGQKFEVNEQKAIPPRERMIPFDRMQPDQRAKFEMKSNNPG